MPTERSRESDDRDCMTQIRLFEINIGMADVWVEMCKNSTVTRGLLGSLHCQCDNFLRWCSRMMRFIHYDTFQFLWIEFVDSFSAQESLVGCNSSFRDLMRSY